MSANAIQMLEKIVSASIVITSAVSAYNKAMIEITNTLHNMREEGRDDLTDEELAEAQKRVEDLRKEWDAL